MKVLESREKLPEYSGMKNVVEIKDHGKWFGHTYGLAVGFIHSNGTIESYLMQDRENHTTEIFERIKNDFPLIEKYRTYINRETLKERSGTEYFILYEDKNHSSLQPTVCNTYIDNCSNVHYSVAYEILLVADEEYNRYITVEFETEGSYAQSFFDQIESFEDLFDEWFDDGTHGFGINGDGEKFITFYNDIGEKVEGEIHNVSEALSMITSVRMIKCDHKIINIRRIKE